MKKFFIKHRNIIMAILSVFLMLGFGMLGSGPKTDDQLKGVSVGKLDGKNVTLGQTQQFANELDILASFGFFRRGQSDIHAIWSQQGGDDNQLGLYYYLLYTEAAKYAYVPMSLEGAFAQATAAGTPQADVINELNGKWHISTQQFPTIVSHYRTVENYVQLLRNFPKPVSSMELTADRALRKAQVEYVPINALRDWDKSTLDVSSKVQAQFDAYKDQVAPLPTALTPPVFIGVDRDDKGFYALIGYPGSAEKVAKVHANETIDWDGSKILGVVPGALLGYSYDMAQISGGGRTQALRIASGQTIRGTAPAALPPEVGGHHYPFGYKIPDRVKVEFIKLPRQSLRAAMKVTAKDAEEALKAFKDDPTRFTRNKPATASAPATATAPATQTAPATTTAPATQTAPATDTAPATQPPPDWDDPAIRKPFLDEQLDLRVARLLTTLVNNARTKSDARWNSDSVARKDWYDYTSLAQSIQNDPQATPGYKVEVGNSGPDFLTPAQLLSLPGMGRAIYSKSQGDGVEIFDLATLATNVVELVPPDRTKSVGRLALQVGKDLPELTDADGNVYLLRVTDIDKNHVPTLEEVRKQVEADCRKLAKMQEAQTALEEAIKKSPDMEVLAKQYQSEMFRPAAFSRLGNVPPEIRMVRDFTKAALALPDPKDTGKPSVTVLANDENFSLFAIRVTSVIPADGRTFQEMSEQLIHADEPSWMTFFFDYVRGEELAHRLNFTLANGKWPEKKPAVQP